MNTDTNKTKTIKQGLTEFAIFAATVTVFLGIMWLMGGTSRANDADEGLVLLEAAYNDASGLYDSNIQLANDSIDAANKSADTLCSAYRALRAYKEMKEYELSDPLNNPCTQKRGFMIVEPEAQ